MLRIKTVVAMLFFMSLSAVAVSAQENSKMPATMEIKGTVQSFSGDILDIWPATAPPVWVTVPHDMKVDRSEVTPGAEVSVEARWAGICYVAVKAPEVMAAKSASR